MKQSEALQHIRAMIWAVQRFRSIQAENGNEDIAALTHPWLYERDVLGTCLRMEANAESGKGIQPIDFYNLMCIAARSNPELDILLLGCYKHGKQADCLPKPDGIWLRGWESEDSMEECHVERT